MHNINYVSFRDKGFAEAMSDSDVLVDDSVFDTLLCCIVQLAKLFKYYDTDIQQDSDWSALF